MILPGDILWERYRVLRVESERLHRAWLAPLHGAGAGHGSDSPHLLLSLEAPACCAMTELLTLLWPGVHGETAADVLKNFDVLGAVEYRGVPGQGGVALIQPAAAASLHQSLAHMAPIVPARVFEYLWILSGMLDQKFNGPDAARHADPHKLCGALAKLLNPSAMGLNAKEQYLVFTARREAPAPELRPPAWTRYAAPEVLRGEACGQPALVYGVARMALALLGMDRDEPRDSISAHADEWRRLALRASGDSAEAKAFLSDPRAAGLPADFRLVLAKCLKTKASARYPTLARLNAAFKKLSHSEWARAYEEELANAPRHGATPPAPQSADRKKPPEIPPGMVLVEAGQFLSGEKKVPRTLRAFAIDVTPVTEKDYREFLKEIKREPRPGGPGSRPPKYDKHPAVNATWREAEEYAEHFGKRLPTIYEWEKAARGADGRKFTYGNSFLPGTGKLRATAGGAPGKDAAKDTAPVGNYPLGASPFGVLDMAGNVLEWTTTARRQGERIFRALKGTCFLDGSIELTRCAGVQYKKPDTRESHVGFRCVKDLE